VTMPSWPKEDEYLNRMLIKDISQRAKVWEKMEISGFIIATYVNGLLVVKVSFEAD
jgi:hypothetical protein